MSVQRKTGINEWPDVGQLSSFYCFFIVGAMNRTGFAGE